ncbi:MAG TPA: MmgE/PrpD family protein, partial [Burkholderiales bacterium]|nr:MmgE/PrpD family protein [Burkholderiales bacterium]
MKDPIHTFAQHFANARYEDLSSEIIKTVKMTVLDTTGAALAGSASEAGRSIAQIAKGYGGG